MFNVCDEQSSFWTSFSLSSVAGWGLGGLCEDTFRGPLADEVCCGWVDRQPRASVTLSGHVVCSHTRSRQGQLPLSPLLAWSPHSLRQTHTTHLPVIPSHQQHTRPSSLPRVARSLAPTRSRAAVDMPSLIGCVIQSKQRSLFGFPQGCFFFCRSIMWFSSPCQQGVKQTGIWLHEAVNDALDALALEN